MTRPLAAATAVCALGVAPMVQAAKLRIIAGGSMTASLNALAPELEKAMLAASSIASAAGAFVPLSNVPIAPGVELAGPFSGELQHELVFPSAHAADTKESDAAKALIDYPKTPPATAIIKAAGMTPG